MNFDLVEDEVILNQICVANGIDRECLSIDGAKYEKLEIFFSGFPRIIKLHAFPNLCQLIIVNQPISAIENLDICQNLVSLWICECEIANIEGLDQCGLIRNLYLYDNKISKIHNLYSLRMLEVLWLNNNIIECIEGLEELIILRELNLSGNLIKKVENSLKSNISLEKLSLSGNLLNDTSDILNLCKLPKLKHLIINGPDYIPNPVFYHTNFYLFMIYHFTNLKRLDTFDIDSNYIKDIITNIISKKKLFYFMKMESFERDASFMKSQLKMIFNEVSKYPKLRLSNLLKLIKLIDMINAPNDLINLSNPEKKMFLKEANELNCRITSVEKVLDSFQLELEFYLNKVEVYKKEIKSLCQMEFSSCGNFKFEFSSDKIWVNLCNELLNSRFCNSEFNINNFQQIKTHRVIKIKNYQIESNYNKIFQMIYEQNEDHEYLELNNCKMQDYLFLYVEENDDRNLISIINYLYSLSEGEVIKLTNSLYNGDIIKMKSKPSIDKIYYGRVIMVKAFIGSIKKIEDSELNFEKRVSELSLYETFRVPSKICSNNICSCSDYKYDWYFKTNKLLVPEYIVDFEYILKDITKSHFYYTFHGFKENAHPKTQTFEYDNEFGTLKQTLELESIKRNPLTLFRDIEGKCLDNITIINFTNSHLKNIPEISLLKNLTELIIPFNDLLNLRDIKNQKLKILDVSYNNIQTLEEMHELLDLSWFSIQNNFLATTEEISFISKRAPNLINLNVKYNLFQKLEIIRLKIIIKLKHLKVFNEKEIHESEKKSASEKNENYRISESRIINFGRTDTIKPRTLTIDNLAGILLLNSDNKINYQMTDNSKFLRITSLCINYQSISKISNIEKLENLKYLSLSNNCISKIEGLDCCIHLEELILDNNMISQIENLYKLQKLRKFSINDNCINSVSYLKNLLNLQIISFHTNKVSSLNGIECSNNLVELYAANNCILDSSEISYLKSLNNLIILDLLNNPITYSNKNYRLNLIFNLKHLKGLDGICVENSEIFQSKDVLGGRLNLDFISEKIGNEDFNALLELDLSNCNLKSVDLNPVEKIKNLRSLNLENNNLTSFSGLISLCSLRVLCLNSNSIESVLPKLNNKIGIQPIQKSDNVPKVNMKSLEVLHMGYNNIKSIIQLGLHEFPNLKALFLQGNDISIIDGLDFLINLRELVLDQNRIKSISETSLINNVNLREIHLDDNRLKNLANIFNLKHLKRFYVGNNKISNLHDLDLFYSFESLIDVSLFGNPVSRRNQHRHYLIHMVPTLLMIDGIEITDEERMKVESNMDENTDNNILPGILNQNRFQNIKSNSNFFNPNDFCKTDYFKVDNNHKKRPNAINSYNFNNKTNSIQLVANSKAVYFYDPINQIDSIPRLNLNKRK